jgi:hypothetical protein
LNGGTSADFTSAYLWGLAGSTRFLEDLSFITTYYNYQDAFVLGGPGRAEARTWLENFCNQRIASAEAALADEEKNGGDAVVFNQLRSRGVQGKDLASETLDHFLAGAEGPKIALTYLQWALSKDTNMQDRLRKELLTLDPSDFTSDLIALDNLPLLDAVLTETLRTYTPFPSNQYRITPPEGTTIDGLFIPGNVEISSPLGVLQHNPAVFSEPDRWNPDRWLIDDQSQIDEMRKWIWVFNKGSRICTGKDFILIGKLPSPFVIACSASRSALASPPLTRGESTSHETDHRDHLLAILHLDRRSRRHVATRPVRRGAHRPETGTEVPAHLLGERNET